MLRRLLAAALALTVAVPLPALASLAGPGCTMDAPMIAAERCDCCTAPMAAGPSPCGVTSGGSGYGCEIRPDTSRETRSTLSSTSPTVHFQIEATRLSAELTTPRRSQRLIALAASPPGAGAGVSRPVLCSWII